MAASASAKRRWRRFMHQRTGRVVTVVRDSMHELSIAMSILDIAGEEAERRGNVQVQAIYLKIGTLSGVVKEALLSAYELAAEQTPFAQARLIIEDVPGRELQISAMELSE